jgi:hypothetical protein
MVNGKLMAPESAAAPCFFDCVEKPRDSRLAAKVQRPVGEARAALQLQIMAPSWRLSHSRLDWQLSDFCSSLQSAEPMQAHLRLPSGVSKQLKFAQAFEQASTNAAAIISI